MKKLFNAFMERAIHDDEMEKAQELAKGFPDDIALPQAMGFQAGYNAALAELENPGEEAEAAWKKLLDHFSANNWRLNEDVCLDIFQSFAASYHAKKCAECVKRDTPIGCRSCADYPCALSSDSNATCCDGKFWNLKEPPHAL